MLKVYADESGIEDGAKVTCLGGLIETREYWKTFCNEWRSILKNYDAKFFHYREFRLDANTHPGDPYYGWPLEKRRNFQYRLAMLIGESTVPVGGGYATELNKKQGNPKDPFVETIRAFFDSTIAMLNLHFNSYDGRIHFIFDNTTKREWTGPLHEIYEEYKNKDDRIAGITFGDDKKEPLDLPLQAADFSTMHYRNALVKWTDLNGLKSEDVRIIEFIVHKNQDPHFRMVKGAAFQNVINEMIKHEKKMTAEWRAQDLKRTYYPAEDFPFEQYGYQKPKNRV